MKYLNLINYLKLILLIAIGVTVLSCKKITDPIDNRDILGKIQSIEGVNVIEITPQNGYSRQFEIDITQPIDHHNPNGETFLQRIYLSHVDESAPMIFATSGYSARASYQSELSDETTLNQIQVAHRYMSGAEPVSFNWEYLTIEQAAADLHNVVEIFNQIYTEAWISFGGSKNGMTALFHRRFYPDDVIATVALYTPLPKGIDDPRFDNFLENIGSISDRNKIKRFQRILLENREDILPMIKDYIDNSGLTYELGEDIILEYEVCEYPFAFWQLTNGDCSVIPDSTSSVEELYNYLKDQGGFVLYSEEYIRTFEPVYYQAYTEFGWYRLINDHLIDLLVTIPEPSYSSFAPQNTSLIFRPQVMEDIIDWLETDGDNIVYIYGGNDPWTASAIESIDQTNSIKIIQQNANHQLRINNIDEKQLVFSTLETWTGIQFDASLKRGTLSENEEYRIRKILNR